MPAEHVHSLRARFPQHTFVSPSNVCESRDLLSQADVAFMSRADEHDLKSATRLKWIQVPAVGVRSWLTPFMRSSDIVLTNAKGVRSRAIAEHACALMLAFARQIHTALRAQVRHEWAQHAIDTERPLVHTLQGKRLGLIGLGSIGAEIAQLASSIGMHVSAVRRRTELPKPSTVIAVVPPEERATVLAQSDYVVLAAPSTNDTGNCIGRSELEIIKRGAILINVSRGRLIDDAAVMSALADGRLGGAALDVFRDEPLAADHPYWDMPNVIVSPHVAGAMPDYWDRLVNLFADNLRRFEQQDELLNVVDKAHGY